MKRPVNPVDLLPRYTSVGALTKRIVELRPDLGIAEIIAIVRQSTVRRPAGEGRWVESVDESQALELARAGLKR